MSGKQLGAMHLLRVGQEVIVSFRGGGDIDWPLCTGRLHHQDSLPPWSLAEQQVLSASQASKEPSKFPELSEPHLVLASPAGIASTTAGPTHQHSGQHHAITSGGHTSVSAGKSWLVSAQEAIRMFAYKAGIRLISARKDIDIQALQTNIHLLAKLKITHTAQRIEITAKEEVLVNGGGSYRRWSASGIEQGTTGRHTAHAASHSLMGPKSMGVNVHGLPDVQAFDERFTYKLPSSAQAVHLCFGLAVSQAAYLATTRGEEKTPATHTVKAEPLTSRFVPVAVDVPPDAGSFKPTATASPTPTGDHHGA